MSADGLRQCVACGADFEPVSERQEFCKFRRCKLDRALEAQAKHYSKVKSEPGFNRMVGIDNTNTHRSKMWARDFKMSPVQNVNFVWPQQRKGAK